jgi:hypothetical protein
MARPLFTIGGIGMILLGITGIIYWLMYAVFYYLLPGTLPWIAMAGVSTLIFVAALLGGLGLLGYKLYNGKILGLKAFIVTVVFSWWLMVSDVMTVVGIDFITPLTDILGRHLSIDSAVWFLGYFFLGFVFLYWGMTLIQTASETGKKRLSVAAGVMYLIAGIGYMLDFGGFLVWEIVLFQFGAVMLLAGGILGAMVFLTAETKQTA